MPPRKVFLSYRSVDRDRVRIVAEALLAKGIDAWWDVWEIRPGDSFVSKINDGLEQCECGVVFLSNESLNGAWHKDEIEILKTYAVDDKRPLIPVVLDPTVKVPGILRNLSRLSADQIDALADAILYRSSPDKPPLGPTPTTATRTRFTIHLAAQPNNTIAVSALLNDKPLVPAHPVTPGADFAFSYSDFLHARPTFTHKDSASAAVAAQERDLLKLGDAVGRVVFSGEIATQLAALLQPGDAHTQELELIFESESPHLLSIPFESARLPNSGPIPALLPGVFLWRRALSTSTPITKPPSPGPLKILVAVGAPDEGKAHGVVLDSELELQTILNAVQGAHDLGNAYVRVLEIGHPDQIGLALRQLGYHVLHLSGHGSSANATIELEDEDGNPVETTAATLAAKIKESGHPPPLIVLASCHGGVGSNGTASFAQALLTEGVPAVLAMQTAVSDAYCTALTGKFYEELSHAEIPLATRALALARRTLETARLQSPEKQPPEYATPSLFLTTAQDQPVLTRTGDQSPVPETSRKPSAGLVPLLPIGDLIGRRQESRQILRILTDDPKATSQFGRKAGCQILGSGGVGKSTLAGRVMQRMADRNWPVVTLSGKWNLTSLCEELASVLLDHPQKDLAALAAKLNAAPDNLRPRILAHLLTNHQVLLVLDNFEDLLETGGTAFSDPIAEQLFAGILQSCQRAKLLITSRYPIPGAAAESRLHRINLGPLSAAETRKLMLRHEGLKSQPSANLKLIERAIGGHPRTLEYLDALLRSGTARLDTVGDRLAKFASQEGISLDNDTQFEAKLQDAIRIAAADAMVRELVRLVAQNPSDLHLLWQASVFPFAVPAEALAFDPAAPDDALIDAKPLAPALRRLAATSLLTPQENNQVYVHRWTAESLKPLMPAGVYSSNCSNAARYLIAKPQGTPSFIESIRLFLSAEAFDDATSIAGNLIRTIKNRSQLTLATELAGEVARSLPPDHHLKGAYISREADGLLALGLGEQALERHRSALEFNEARVAKEPQRADYLRELSVSYNKMGDLESALGNGESARQFFEKGLEIAERLVAQEPQRADYLRDLSVSYNKMGDLESALGNGESARQYFEKDLAIAERLLSQEPQRADYLRDLSVSYNKMGDLESALGNGTSARQFYEKSLELRERLVSREPQRADYLRDLSVSYNKMGDLESDLGNGESARQFFENALAIAERLVSQEPRRADYLRHLYVSYWRMGDVNLMKGDLESALELHNKALQIAERLTTQESERADYARDLSMSYNKMGDLESALGNGDSARQFFEKSLQFFERLVSQEPQRADYLRDLSVSYIKMGDLERDLGNGESARQFFEKALEIAERLVSQEPQRADYLRDLSASYNRMGALERSLGNSESARQFMEKDLAIAERLAAQEPNRSDYQVDVAISLMQLRTPAHLQRALDILLHLKQTNRLNKADEPKIARVQELLRVAKSAGA